MRKKLFIIMCFLLTILSTGCSSDNDTTTNETNLPSNWTDEAIEDFFNTELPVTHHSLEYFTSHSFFCEDKSGMKSAIKENIVCVINSRQELAEIYLGEKEIPEIDFEKNTLIIGQQIMPCHGFYVAKKELLEGNDGLVLTLYAKNDCEKFALGLQNLYFWEFYPKLSHNTISVNVITEYTNRPDLQNTYNN